MAKITWQVLEDNGGGLYLVVLDSEDRAVGFYTVTSMEMTRY